MSLVITIPKSLREKLGPECANDLAEMFNKVEESRTDHIISLVEEKFERRLTEVKEELRSEIINSRAQLEEKIANSRAQLEEKIANSRAQLEEKIAEVRVEISKSKADLIKWIFLFWLGQISVITGILFAFFK